MGFGGWIYGKGDVSTGAGFLSNGFALLAFGVFFAYCSTSGIPAKEREIKLGRVYVFCNSCPNPLGGYLIFVLSGNGTKIMVFETNSKLPPELSVDMPFYLDRDSRGELEFHF